MTRIFADADYWVALLNDQDQRHPAAQTMSGIMQGATIVTTDEVLTEVLAYFSERGRYLRRVATAFVKNIMNDPTIVVLPQSHRTFLDGLGLYEARPDKGYSLTDCISMQTMRRAVINEVLTHDAHFTQEGFVILL